FPTLSDDATLHEMSSRLSADAPLAASPLRQEAAEVAWLLGTPFLVQIIEGAGDDIAAVVAGPVESSGEGQSLLDARWKVEIDRPVDVVLGGISGDPGRHTFTDLARAFLAASRIVKPGGRVALLTDAAPPLGPAAAILRRAGDPAQALKLLAEEK